MSTNPITLIDGYKLSHKVQYPEGTTNVYSNWTARGTRVPGVNKVVFFGLQGFLKWLNEEFDKGFFSQNVDKVCEAYQKRINGYLGPNNVGTDHIRALHTLGYLPLRFKALPEGTFVPLRVPMFTVENTLPEFFWLTNYLESILSAGIWKGCTSATSAAKMRGILNKAAEDTGTDPGFVQWQGHDFSFRGMSTIGDAQLSGAGHLLFFTGTDTIPAMDYVEDYYGPIPDNYLLAGSVPATEHSVMCAGGEENEMDTFNRLLDIYPTGILSVVSDTWDLFGLITNILPQLKDRIVGRNGKLVIRPDSGDPVKIICGDPDSSDPSVKKGVIELLWDIFGGTLTSTGHKMLDSHIGCIYGDSINFERCQAIVDGLASKGFASGNMVFGVGSYTYEYVTRDTHMFAMKATSVVINGVQKNIFKAPKTDDGMKNSAKGRLAVLLDGSTHELYLVNEATPTDEAISLLTTVWENGKFTRFESFDKIRERALKGL